MPFWKRKRYRVQVMSELLQSPVSASVTTWTEVRACVGNAVETALGTLPEGKALDAYTRDVPTLLGALTGSQARQEAEGSEGWRFNFSSLPLVVTVRQS
jgi:hypothetical protein